MPKNILVLTGSPRKGGNSDLLADSFIIGAKEAGHSVNKIRTASKDIDDCKACDACFSKDGACVFDDEFNELAPLIEKADVLVLATPLYWFTFPASLKAAIDKLYAFIIGEREIRIKECVLLACAGDDSEEVFGGLVASYKLIADFQKWADRGVLLVPGVMDKGDIQKTGALEKAARIGREM